ncbi:bystin [Cloeon dipterum]|uniref:bystin n=1 Tax=Cloeon dipterum TaxID=197152 RepID=UPI003220424E
MGKSKKLKVSKGEVRRSDLETQLEDDKFAKPSARVKAKRSRQDEDDEFVDSSLSKKILRLAGHQKRDEEGVEQDNPGPSDASLGTLEDFDDEFEDEMQGDDYCNKIELDEDEERTVDMFLNKDRKEQTCLADIVMAAIRSKQSDFEAVQSVNGGCQVQDIQPEVKELYQGVGKLLVKYRSGKLPKAFKIIPRLRNWEQMLLITETENWSAAAVYQGTRIFASNLTEKMTQRFYNVVLLPRVRDDIAEYKRLNFHLYQALRKALFKPAAFMRGILIPLCESRDCTLREAIIIGSVLARNSIPILHSCAAILKIAELEYTGATSVFIRILLDKKYALPYRVTDALVFHFLRVGKDERQLPVLWHQSFLTFVQRYKNDISSEQRDALLDLLRSQNHHSISAEVRRELQSAQCKDLRASESEPMDQ